MKMLYDFSMKIKERIVGIVNISICYFKMII